MAFVKLTFYCSEETGDMLMSELAEAGYDIFAQTDDGFETSIEEEHFFEEIIINILEKYTPVEKVTYKKAIVQKANWNEEWEKNYQPVIIDNECIIRATFHPSAENFPYEIVINPKMSFGTGHHETTQLMIRLLLNTPVEKKTVFDAGCGTGILGIFACMLGANKVSGCDIEEWAIENTFENFSLNKFSPHNIYYKEFPEINHTESYDVILANINKNVLLREIPAYLQNLKKGGFLLMSGFYVHDLDDIVELTSQHGAEKMEDMEENNWCAAKFQKL